MHEQYPIEFISYKDSYHADIRRLSLEWLEKYVSVEPEDLKFINDPQGYVLDQGGYIYLAKYNEEIVGTVSLCKVNEDEYELAKLAVTEKYKGLKLGKQLMQLAIDKCRKIGAKRVVLYTAKKLEAAYNLYLKFGFIEIEGAKQKYEEADLKMVLELSYV